MSEKKIVAWYLNVRWSEKVNNEWEEEIYEMPVSLIRHIDTFLDGVEEERNKEQDFTEEESQGKVYDPPMSDTEQYLLNKEREEEHKSHDY